MVGEERLECDLLDHAGLAGRHLADDGGEDRVTAMRDRGDLHDVVELLQVHVAVRLAERPLRLEPAWVDQALDHDLRLGRHHQVDRLTLHDVERNPGQAAGDRELVHVVRQLGDRRAREDRWCTDDDRALERLAPRPRLVPVRDDALLELVRRVHAQLPAPLEMPTVVPRVVDAGLGILRHVVARGDVRGVVPPRGRDRNW